MRAVMLCVGLCWLVGCDPEAKLCHERMTSAQPVVTAVDSKSIPSLEQALAAVSEAHAACEKAKLGDEREQLLKAKNELTAQIDLLKAREGHKKAHAPTPEELARLVKSGDPSCPKGQAYKPKDSKDEVRCTGPQIADMDATALKSYFSDRGFKVSTKDAPAEVRAALGAELYVFSFEKWGDSAPRCVTAFTAPGMSWQEVTSRLTGTPPDKLKLGTPVKSGRGALELKVEHETDQPTIHLGSCG